MRLRIPSIKKGDAEDLGNYRGITLLNVVGKLFCKILNCLVSRLESERAFHDDLERKGVSHTVQNGISCSLTDTVFKQAVMWTSLLHSCIR